MNNARIQNFSFGCNYYQSRVSPNSGIIHCSLESAKTTAAAE
jgi:hypothetical protein